MVPDSSMAISRKAHVGDTCPHVGDKVELLSSGTTTSIPSSSDNPSLVVGEQGTCELDTVNKKIIDRIKCPAKRIAKIMRK